ncbi:MAG: DUF6516 family protein [Methanosarcinales archaeon]
MTPLQNYFTNLKARLTLSHAIDSYQILLEKIKDAEGYIKIKSNLIDGTILYIFEYVVINNDKLETIKYRYHLQDDHGNLIKRWDNAPHHQEIETFPDHVHEGEKLKPSNINNLEKLLSLLEVV